MIILLFIYVFNGADDNQEYIGCSDWMVVNNELGGIWKEVIVT
jgi:hypothetical protein